MGRNYKWRTEMLVKTLILGCAIWASAGVVADAAADWQCLTNALCASFDLNPSNRTDMQQVSCCGKCFRMREVASTELVATNREVLFACLDDIGMYVLLPTNAYVEEVAYAKQAYSAWKAMNPPTRTPGVVQEWPHVKIEGTGKFGTAVYERWEPVLSRNKQIGAYRRKVLDAFKPAILRHRLSIPEDMRAAFQTNVMERASLSAQEMSDLFAQ